MMIVRSGFVPVASEGRGVGVDTPAHARTRWDVVGRRDHAHRAAGSRTWLGGHASRSPMRCMTPAGPEPPFLGPCRGFWPRST